MEKLALNSYAKLNLYLRVLNKRGDGYHNIETLFERIDLCDKIIITVRPDKKIRIISGSPYIPKDSSNLAFKSAKLLQNSFNVNKGADIKIIKRIPVGSGMGGGSSNAAAVLTALNKLWELNLNRRQLAVYGGKLGADVPFFIYDTSFAIGRHRGDKIRSLSNLNNLKLTHILVVPRIKVGTPEIYAKWDELKASKNKIETLTIPQFNAKLLTSAISGNTLSLINKSLFNSLEQVTSELYPEIRHIKEELVRLGLRTVLMSGSGPTVFGFVHSGKEVQSLYRQLKKNRFWRVFVTHTV